MTDFKKPVLSHNLLRNSMTYFSDVKGKKSKGRKKEGRKGGKK